MVGLRKSGLCSTGRKRLPPLRAFAVIGEIEGELPEHTVVAEDQLLPGLNEDEMIAFLLLVIERRHVKPPRHSEMQPQPYAAGKLKKHLLPVRFTPDQCSPRESVFNRHC